MIARYERVATELGAVASPIRLACLKLIAEGRERPHEVYVVLKRSDQQLTLSLVSYHVRKLLQHHLIVVTYATKVRGATQHYYSVTEHGRLLMSMVETLCENGA